MIVYHYNKNLKTMEENLCVICGVNMGPCNPRQYCGKIFCYKMRDIENIYDRYLNIINKYHITNINIFNGTYHLFNQEEDKCCYYVIDILNKIKNNHQLNEEEKIWKRLIESRE